MSADIFLNASELNEIVSKTELLTNSRKFFKKYLFNNEFKEESNDLSFKKFESKVKLVNVTSIGVEIDSIEIEKRLNYSHFLSIMNLFANQFSKSKAVILSSQEPISSLVDHDDFNSINLETKNQIKEYLDGTYRTYVERNSFKVSLLDIQIESKSIFRSR